MADNGDLSGASIRKLFQQSDTDGTSQSTPAAASGADIRKQFQAADEAAAKAAGPVLPGPAVPSADEQSAETGLSLPSSPSPALNRIGEAISEGWSGVPAIPRVPANLVMSPIYNPLIATAETALRAGGAGLRGLQEAAVQLLPNQLGRDVAALPEAFPFGTNALRPPGRPPILEALPTGPRFVSELTAPPRPPGMTDAARINQLVEHAVNEEQPAVGPPMARGPTTQKPTPAVGGGPQPSAGVPAGGAATPGEEMLPGPQQTQQITAPRTGQITPIRNAAQADAEADRIIQYFAQGGPTEIDSTPLPSGAKPTLSQSIKGGNAGIAGLERGVRDVPEQTQQFVAQEQANIKARNQVAEGIIGDRDATNVKEAQLDAETGPQKNAVFANTTPTDPSAAVAKIDAILASEKGQVDAIRGPLEKVRTQLVNKDGNMQTDPLQLYGIDRNIRYMTGPKAAGTAADGRAAAYELGQVVDALRPSIEAGAPGFTDYMANQAARRSEIDGERWLQSRNITDAHGNVNLQKLDTTIKTLENQQALPGKRLADGVTPEQLAKLKALQAEYQNDAKQRLGVSIGSPTVQKLGVSGAAGMLGHPLLSGAVGAAGAYTAGVNPLLGLLSAAGSYAFKAADARGQRLVMDALRNKLLNPELARGAFSTGTRTPPPNPLTQPPPSP